MTWITTSHKKNFARNGWVDGYLTETFGVNVLEIQKLIANNGTFLDIMRDFLQQFFGDRSLSRAIQRNDFRIADLAQNFKKNSAEFSNERAVEMKTTDLSL